MKNYYTNTSENNQNDFRSLDDIRINNKNFYVKFYERLRELLKIKSYLTTNEVIKIINEINY